MNNVRKQSGLTLTELLVVVAIMAIMFAISVPAAKALFASLDQSTGTRSIINAALSNARAIAIRHGTYAGVRFQMDNSGRQYLVFVIHDFAATGLANGFRVVEGKKPMPLPENVGIIAAAIYTDNALKDSIIATNAGTISVVFNKGGTLEIHPVRVRNKDGRVEPDNTSTDKVFNVKSLVASGYAQFTQDDYPPPAGSFGEENSVNSFLIYDKREWDKNKTAPWTGYLLGVSKSPEYVNPYTGQLVDKNPQ